MKWIGQHIVDLIARFRGDVYLEDIDTGTIASGSHLGLDSNNKIVKAVDGGGDITGVALTAASGIDLTSVSGATGGAYAATVGVDVSDFMTNGTDNYVLTATGADAMNAEANLTFSGTKLSATTSSSPGFLIDHTSSTNSAYGLKLNQGPPGLGISVDHNETRTAGIGGRGLNVDYDKTAVLADGQTGIYNGTNVNLYDQVTNHSGSTFTQTGHYTSIIATGSTGAMTNIGYDASIGNLAGGGTNIGFQSNAFTEGGIDFYSIGETALYATNSTDDYFKIVTAVNGATTLTTRDAAAAAAHFEIEAGGDITLDSAGQIKLEPVAGNNILLDGTIAVDAGVVTGATSITSTAFVGTLSTASQPNITGVGTIGTGVWNGTAVASAYLDSDTAHLTTAQTFTGSKTMGTTTKFNFRDANSYIYSPTANDLEIVATDITLDAASDIFLQQDTTITGNLNANGIAHVFASSTASKPVVTIKNTANDGTSGLLQFYKDRGAAGVNGGKIGEIVFLGENDAQETISYGNIRVKALEVDDTDEAGQMSLQVTESNGTATGLTTGLLIEGSDNTTDGEVNVEIAAGAASITKINGSLRPKGQIVLMRSAFKDDIGTTKHYIPLQSELEQTSATHEMNSFVAPFAGKLLKIMFRGSGNFSASSAEFTFTLEQIPRNVAFNTTATTLETIAIAGPTNNTTDPNMVIADFVGGGGTNAFTAGDIIQVGIQSDTDVTGGSSKLFFTFVFEFDFSGLA